MSTSATRPHTQNPHKGVPLHTKVFRQVQTKAQQDAKPGYLTLLGNRDTLRGDCGDDMKKKEYLELPNAHEYDDRLYGAELLVMKVGENLYTLTPEARRLLSTYVG